MKKYFLLAGTALLISGQAWAGSIATDKQSATVNLKATLRSVDSKILTVTDIDFGTLVFDGTDATFTMDNAGNITATGASVLSSPATGTPGHVEVSYSGGYPDLSVSCADAEQSSHDVQTTGCSFEFGTSGIAIFKTDRTTLSTRGFSGHAYFGGSIKITDMPESMGTYSVNEPIIKLTLSY